MNKRKALLSLAVIVLPALISPFASKLPDGLEKAAEKLGIQHYSAGRAAFKSPLPDYTLPSPGAESINGRIAAGAAGAAIVFILMTAIGRLIRKRESSSTGKI